MLKTSITVLLCLLGICCQPTKAQLPFTTDNNITAVDYQKILKIRQLSVKFLKHFNNITVEDLLPASQAQPRLPSKQDKECVNELSHLIKGLATAEYWALSMIDAWGSIPSGLLYGNLKDLGNFEECIRIKSELTNGNNLRGKYCFAELPAKKLLYLDSLIDSSKISTAICLPSSCTGAHLNTLFTSFFNHLLNVSDSFQFVDDKLCQIEDNQVPFDGLTIFTIFILSVLCCLVVLATLYDYFLCVDQKRMIKAFSARANSSDVFRFVDSKSNPNAIDCLHGLRCLSCIWVVYGHDYLLTRIAPNINLIRVYNWLEGPFSMIIVHAPYSVDTFFFLSGLLLVLGALRSMKRQKGKLNVFMMYFLRYLRLTPMVALAILAYWKLLPYMGSGPLWGRLKIENYDLCERNWYYTLLYVQNYATDYICIGHTWYLAVDMQLYIISPILLFALYKWGKKAVAGIVVLLLLLAACLFSMMVINHYSLQFKGNPPPNSQKKIYLSTQTRTSPWLIGFIFGYFLHVNRGKIFILSQPKVWLGWLISMGLFFTCVFALHADANWKTPAISHVNEAFYLTLTRIAWPLGLCWVVFACMQGYGGLANSFLSAPIWQPFSRLSYSIYIWHIFIQTINLSRTQTSTYASDYDVILRFWADFGLTVILAFFIHIGVEAPLGELQNMMFRERKTNKGPKREPIASVTDSSPGCSNTPLQDNLAAVNEAEN